MKDIIVVIGLLVVSCHATAQQDSTATGEVVNAEIVIEKDKKITLPKAEKIAEPLPAKDFDAEPYDVTYEAIQPDFNWPAYKSEISFIPVDEPYPTPSYQNYVLAGYGNFSSPLFGLGVFQQINRVKLNSSVSYEGFGKGPVAGKNSSSSDLSINISAGYKGENFSLTPKLFIEGGQYKFYGNTDRLNTGFSDAAPAEVALQDVRFAMELEGSKNDWSYSVEPTVFSTNQELKDLSKLNEESGVGIDAGLELKMDESLTAGLDLNVNSATYSGGLSYDRSLFQLRPWVGHSSEALDLKVGFGVTSNKTASNSKSGFYPFASGEWSFLPKWRLFGSIESGIIWNDLNLLLEENQFLDDSLQLLNTERTYAIGGGIKGSPISNLNIKAGLNLDNLKNLPFYIPSSSDSSRYTLTYDSGTVTIFTFSGEVNYQISPNSLVGLGTEFYGYSVSSLERPWHLPSYTFTLFTSHKIKEKILFDTEIIAQGGIRSPVNGGFGFINLDAFVDANLSATYLLTDRASAFVRVNNLFSKEYEKYLGYPVRGLAFKLGAKYRF